MIEVLLKNWYLIGFLFERLLDEVPEMGNQGRWLRPGPHTAQRAADTAHIVKVYG